MTNVEVKKAERLISTEDIYAIGNKLISELKPGFDPMFYADSTGSKLSRYRGQMFIGRAVNLFRRCYYMGATSDELAHIAMHWTVLITALTENLNYRQSEIDNGIKELNEKYSVEEFLKMDFSVIKERAKHEDY